MSQVSHIPQKRFFGQDLCGPVTCGLLALAMAYSLAWTISKTDEFQDADFGAYYRAAGAVGRGETPYTVDEHGPLATFRYAPAYAYLLEPLGRLDYLWAVRIWMLFNWAIVVACMVLALRLVLGNDCLGQAVWGMVWLTVQPLLDYFWANVRAGQVGGLMLAFCLGWALCQRQGQRFLGGILLAAGCALKLAPCFLLPYLLIRRDLRGLAGVIVGSLALFALPALDVGWHGAIRLHGEWLEHSIDTQVPAQTYRAGNQSLLAQLGRLPAISNGKTLYSLSNLQILEHVYPVVLVMLAAGLYGWIFWSRRRRLTPDEDRQRDNLHLAMLLIAMTLAHPCAWRCNFVALIFPWLLLAKHVCRRLPGWKISLAAMFLVLAACAWPTPASSGSDWSWANWFRQGKHFWGAIALAAACAWSYCSRDNKNVNQACFLSDQFAGK